MIAARRLTLVLVSLIATTGACASSRPADARRFTMEVADARRRCVGEAVQQCLVVRRDGDSTWGNFYDAIEGFTHEAGTSYRIEVEQLPVARPPADGSAYRYRLVRIIRQSRRDSGMSTAASMHYTV